MKMTKRMLCLLMMFAMILSTVDSIDSQAKKKTPKLNKKNLTLMVGKSAKLKVKNTKKKVKWTSSKKSVASVSKKGKVKAKKAGKTTITAKVAGKKLKCKVTVKKKKTVNPSAKATAAPTQTPLPAIPDITTKEPVEKGNSIVSLCVKDYYTLEIKLAKKQELTMEDFDVQIKKNAKGSYQTSIEEVGGIVTMDGITYTIFIYDEFFSMGDMIKVTVSNLEKTGTDSMETTFMKKQSCNVRGIYTVKKGTSVVRDLFFSDVIDKSGYLKVTSANLPEGIRYYITYESLAFYGTPKKAGRYVGDVVCNDELGNTFTFTLVWLIDGDDTIAAYASPLETIYKDGPVDVSDYKVSVTGGSGTYTYSIPEEVNGAEVTIDTSGKISATFSKAGTYLIPIEVKDAGDESIQSTFEWKVEIKDTKKITINALTADGTLFEDEMLHVVIANYDESGDYYYLDDVNKGTGYLPAGTYDVVYYRGDYYERKFYQKSLTVKDKDITLDLSFPLYKVKVTCEESDCKWYDENGSFVGMGETLYLPKGTHTLRYVKYDTLVSGTVYESSVFVSDTKENTVTITGKNESNLARELTADALVSVKVPAYNKNTYSFTPEVSGSYTFSYEHVFGYYDVPCLYDSDSNQVTPTTGIQTYMSYEYTYSLEAGKTYCFALEPKDNTYLNINLSVNKNL